MNISLLRSLLKLRELRCYKHLAPDGAMNRRILPALWKRRSCKTAGATAFAPLPQPESQSRSRDSLQSHHHAPSSANNLDFPSRTNLRD